MENFPDQKSVDTLKEYRVEYILIDPLDYADFDTVEERMFELGLVKRSEQSGILVYGFADAP